MYASARHSDPEPSTASMEVLTALPSTHEVQGAPLVVDSCDLLQGQKAVGIQHNGSMYRLQATKLGKLILTK